jgi:hypothetical protein
MRKLSAYKPSSFLGQVQPADVRRSLVVLDLATVWAAFARVYSKSLRSGPTSEDNRRSP